MDASSAARLGRSKDGSVSRVVARLRPPRRGEGRSPSRSGCMRRGWVEPVGSTTLIVATAGRRRRRPCPRRLYTHSYQSGHGGPPARRRRRATPRPSLAVEKGASQAAIAEFGVERISGDQRKILRRRCGGGSRCIEGLGSPQCNRSWAIPASRRRRGVAELTAADVS